ncbi:MAG: hypothetical protein WC708_01135 [Lentisphaeria bacterium]|jgi:hypothetical protein
MVAEGLSKIRIAHELIEYLNTLIEIDPDAIGELIEARVPCNEQLLNHPTVQVLKEDERAVPQVGFLGVLNGFMGVSNGHIIASFDDETGKLLRFTYQADE